MTGWAVKRFWTKAATLPADGGFAVALDGRRVKTPAKRPLVLPTLAMAQAVAEEWDAQAGTIDPASMPVTRAANAALDKVATQFDEVAGLIAAYGGSDLLCYRATGPEPLVRRQARGWNPMLDWADRTFGARLLPTAGIVHKDQDPAALAALTLAVQGQTIWGLTALHDLVGISGSLVLGLAALSDDHDPEDLWRLSRIDEDWQAELWGHDDDAADLAESKRRDFLAAHRFWRLSQEGT
jgi:chaperone required for assembly of F1-ATPase